MWLWLWVWMRMWMRMWMRAWMWHLSPERTNTPSWVLLHTTRTDTRRQMLFSPASWLKDGTLTCPLTEPTHPFHPSSIHFYITLDFFFQSARQSKEQQSSPMSQATSQAVATYIYIYKCLSTTKSLCWFEKRGREKKDGRHSYEQYTWIQWGNKRDWFPWSCRWGEGGGGRWRTKGEGGCIAHLNHQKKKQWSSVYFIRPLYEWHVPWHGPLDHRVFSHSCTSWCHVWWMDDSMECVLCFCFSWSKVMALSFFLM